MRGVALVTATVPVLAHPTTTSVAQVQADVVMPRMSGSEIAEVLLMDHPDMQVLFATGYAEKGIVDEGVLKAGIELLRKPYDHAQLQARIRNLMDRPSRQRS